MFRNGQHITLTAQRLIHNMLRVKYHERFTTAQVFGFNIKKITIDPQRPMAGSLIKIYIVRFNFESLFRVLFNHAAGESEFLKNRKLGNYI